MSKTLDGKKREMRTKLPTRRRHVDPFVPGTLMVEVTNTGNTTTGDEEVARGKQAIRRGEPATGSRKSPQTATDEREVEAKS